MDSKNILRHQRSVQHSQLVSNGGSIFLRDSISIKHFKWEIIPAGKSAQIGLNKINLKKKLSIWLKEIKMLRRANIFQSVWWLGIFFASPLWLSADLNDEDETGGGGDDDDDYDDGEAEDQQHLNPSSSSEAGRF